MSGPVTFDQCDSALTCTAGEIAKISSGNTWNNPSSARSNYGFNSGEGIAIRFKCPTTSAYRMIGFARSTYPTSGTYSNGYTQLTHSIYCVHGGSIQVYESGASRSTGQTYSTTDTMEVRLFPDGTVDYTKNGNVIYTSGVTVSQWPLYAAVSIYTQTNPSISEIQYAAVP